jgi:hypothetical protein
LGDNPTTIYLGSTDTYIDSGAKAEELINYSYYKDISSSIIVGGETVDVSTIGEYYITYEVTSSQGLFSKTYRKVIVALKPGPVRSNSQTLNIYENHTVENVQKRRKEEILEHKQNSARLTKAQQMAQILRGKSSLQKTLGSASQNNRSTNPNPRGMTITNNSLIFPNSTTNKNNTPLYGIRNRYKYSGV